MRLAQAARAANRLDQVERFLQLGLQGTRKQGVSPDADLLFAEIATHCRLQGRPAEALHHARGAQTICGESALLIWEECEALRVLSRKAERVARLNRLAVLQPNDPQILVELGLALQETASAPQAIKPLRAAFALGYNNDEVALSLATVELHTGDAAAAEMRLRGILRNDPQHLGAQGKLWQLLRQQCRWAEAVPLENTMLTRVVAGDTHPALTPFMLLASECDAHTLKQHAIAFGNQSGETEPPNTNALSTRVRPQGAPLRVGYLSSDFHHHATAMLIAGVFESHSTSVEPFAYSYGPRTNDEYQLRLKRAFGDDAHWRDVHDLSDEAAAELIRTDEIDVLIELKGRTYGARMGITARKPAPITLHYLGYPGTLAAAGIDVLVVDSIIAPEGLESAYTETLLRMPNCYQANDAKRARPIAKPRSELGLPEAALVLCNFNQSYKWSERFMRVWMRALKHAPHAVLWLLDSGEQARDSVHALAAEYGVAPQIYWAPRHSMLEHLARLGAANLALDQLPCASHTTGSDALWMGVPLLTCMGETFHGRVGASLVTAAGHPEWIAPNIDVYERMLIDFVSQPAALLALQRTFATCAARSPLFDTEMFTRQWETMLRAAFDAAIKN